MAATTLIELTDICKDYHLGTTKVEALRSVSLSVDRGDFLAVAGPSGSGKSTLLNIIGCIDSPTSGSIVINNREVSNLSDRELTRYRRVTVSFIFQSFNLIPVLTVYENIELPLLLQRNKNGDDRKKKVMHLIEEVGLENRITNKPGELSGGQRQRVAIARALASNPLLVLADEPTANLDSATGAKILNLMRDINTHEGTTFIFSTHDSHIMDRAHRIVTISDGMIVDDHVKKV